MSCIGTGNLDIETVQGNKLTLEFEVFDKDNNPVPLTGLDVYWSARNSITKKQVLSKSTVVGGVVVNSIPDDHKFTVTVDSSETSNIVGIHDHEAIIVDGADIISVKNKDNSFGTINFRERITKISP